ncbi:MAG: hypothetical protein OHK0017_09580 [Patescibacteria group bacterium]
MISFTEQKNTQNAADLISKKKELVTLIQKYDDYFVNNYMGSGSNVNELKEDLKAAEAELNSKYSSFPYYPNDEYSVDYRRKIGQVLDEKFEAYRRVQQNIADLEKVGQIKGLLNEPIVSDTTPQISKLHEIADAYRGLMSYYKDINALTKLESWQESADKVTSLDDSLKKQEKQYEQVRNELLEYFTKSEKGEIYPAEQLTGYEITPTAIKVNATAASITKLTDVESKIKEKYNL